MFTGILAYDWSKLAGGSEYRSTMCRKLMFWCLKTGLMALSGFQQRGLIHRDYKAANILILNGSHLIGDFGLARNVIGYNKTVFPETQLACYLPIDMATHAQFSQIDVWSLGYLLVTQWLSLVYGIPTPEQFNTLGNLHKEFLAWLGTTMSTIKQNPFYLPSDEPVLNVFLRMTVLDSNCRPTAKDFLSQDKWIHNIVDNPTSDLIALFDNLVLIEAKSLNGEAAHTKQKNVLEWFEIMNKTIASLSPDHNPRKIHPRKISFDRRYNIVQVMFSIQRDAAISFKYLSQILGQTYTVTLTNEVKFKRDLAAREELKLQQQQMQQQVYLQQQQQAIDQGIKQQLQEQLKYFYDNRTAQYPQQQPGASLPQSIGGGLSTGSSSSSSGQSTSLPGHSLSMPTSALNHANSAAQPASSTLQSIQQQQQSLLLMQQQQQVQSNQQLLQPLSHSSSMQVQPQQPAQLPPLTHNSSSLLYGKPLTDPNAGFSALAHHNSQSLLPPSQPTQQPTQQSISQQQPQPLRLSPIEQQLSQMQISQQPQSSHQAMRPISPREQAQFQHALSGHLNSGFTAQHSMDAQQHHNNSLLTPPPNHTQLQNNSAQYSQQHNFPPPSHTQLQQLQPQPMLPQGQSSQPQLLQPSQSQPGQLLAPTQQQQQSTSQQQQQQQHLQREKMLHQMQQQQQHQQQQLHQLQQQLHIPSSQPSSQQQAPSQSVPKHASSQTMQFSSAPHGQYPTTSQPPHMMPLANSQQGASHHGQPLQQSGHQPTHHHQQQAGQPLPNQSHGQMMHQQLPPQIPQLPPQQQQSYQPLVPQQKLLDVNPLGYNTGWS